MTKGPNMVTVNQHSTREQLWQALLLQTQSMQWHKAIIDALVSKGVISIQQGGWQYRPAPNKR